MLGSRKSMPERYQKEIEEILRQTGGIGANGEDKGRRHGIRKLVWGQVKESFEGRGWMPSPGRIILVAICLLLSALFLGSVIPGLTVWLGWMGLILFIVGYGMFFTRPRQPVEKRWRGRSIEDGESLWDRLRGRIPRN